MGAETGGCNAFHDLITRVCKEAYAKDPDIGRYCATDPEDLEQEVRMQAEKIVLNFLNSVVVHRLVRDVLKSLKRKKRFSRKVVPLTERVAGELCFGPAEGVLAEVVARDAVRRLCDPRTEQRMSAEAVRLGLAALGWSG